MDEIVVKEITDKTKWEAFLKTDRNTSFLQSWLWGEFNEAIGKRVFKMGFLLNGNLIGTALIILEKAKRSHYLTIPGGPLINWKNTNLVNSFLDRISKIVRDNKCSFVRVRPQLLNISYNLDLFKNLKFTPSPMHLHADLTNQLDISPSEQNLLKNMRKSTRYEIKKAYKYGIIVKKSNDPNDMLGFYQLQLETSRRQRFIPFSYKFLHEQFRVFAREDKALLLSSYYQKKLLSRAFIIFYGNEGIYHYGVSTPLSRTYPGAHLVQWEAIKEAKKRGLSYYNFWGVAPKNSKNHRFYNLSVFKRGFGGTDVEYLPAHDLVINKPKYLINYAIESIRKIYRKL